MRFKPQTPSLESEQPVPVEGETNPFLDNVADPEVAETTPETEIPEAVLVEDTSTSPEAVEAQVQESASDVHTAVTEVEDIGDAIVGLESIAIQLHRIKAAGATVSAESASFLSLAVANATRKFPAAEIGVPAMEDFVLNPERASTVSLESVGVKIKAAFEAFVTMIKNMIQRIAAFMGHITSGGAVAERKAKSLLEKLDKVNTNAKSTKEISFPAVLVNPVLSNGAINKLTDVITSVNKAKFAEVLAIFEKIKQGRHGDITIGELTSEMQKIFESYGKFSDDAYIGNLSFKNTDFPPAIVLVDAEAKSYPCPNQKTVKDYLQSNIKLAQAITELKKTSRERATALGNLMTVLKATQDQLSRDPENLKMGVMALVRGAIQFINKLVSFETRILGRALQASNAINNVAAASITALEAYDK